MNSQFWEACREGDLARVRALCWAGADINWVKQATWEGTGIQAACEEGHAEVVAFLLELPHLQLGIANIYGVTPLTEAFRSSSRQIQLLLLHDGRVDAAVHGVSGITTLMTACVLSTVEEVELLLASGKELRVEHRTRDLGLSISDKSALDMARSRSGPMARLLEGYMADPAQTTALLRRKTGWISRAAQLLALVIFWVDGFLVTGRGQLQLQAEFWDACTANDLDAVVRLSKVVDINATSPFQGAGLHMACMAGSTEVLGFLLQTPRLDASSKDRYGRSAIDLACSKGAWRCLELLLRDGRCRPCSGVDPRESALLLVVRAASLRCLDMLLAAGWPPLVHAQRVADYLKRLGCLNERSAIVLDYCTDPAQTMQACRLRLGETFFLAPWGGRWGGWVVTQVANLLLLFRVGGIEWDNLGWCWSRGPAIFALIVFTCDGLFFLV